MSPGTFLAKACAPPALDMLRFPFMRLPLSCSLALVLSAALAPAALAQAPAADDSARFVIFEQAVPVAHERCVYQFMGDSLVITARTVRRFADEKGQLHEFTKNMALVVDSHDLGLMHYTSVQDFQQHEVVRGLVPGDTAMTYFDEVDGSGSAIRVTQPPGRLFVLDAQLFTLFDVLCRSLAGKEFETRRVQLLALAPDTLTMPVATITLNKPDTLSLGTRRVPARHYSLQDEDVRFELWADAGGRMLRVAHEPTELSVERVADAPSVPRATPRPRRAPIRR